MFCSLIFILNKYWSIVLMILFWAAGRLFVASPLPPERGMRAFHYYPCRGASSNFIRVPTTELHLTTKLLGGKKIIVNFNNKLSDSTTIYGLKIWVHKNEFARFIFRHQYLTLTFNSSHFSGC